MPGKPKRKGKHPVSKRSKALLRQGVAAPPVAGTAPAAPIAQAPAAARPATAARPSTSSRAGASTAGTGAGNYPHFIPELKRIGILSAIIIVILVVLALVLS